MVDSTRRVFFAAKEELQQAGRGHRERSRHQPCLEHRSGADEPRTRVQLQLGRGQGARLRRQNLPVHRCSGTVRGSRLQDRTHATGQARKALAHEPGESHAGRPPSIPTWNACSLAKSPPKLDGSAPCAPSRMSYEPELTDVAVEDFNNLIESLPSSRRRDATDAVEAASDQARREPWPRATRVPWTTLLPLQLQGGRCGESWGCTFKISEDETRLVITHIFRTMLSPGCGDFPKRGQNRPQQRSIG